METMNRIQKAYAEAKAAEMAAKALIDDLETVYIKEIGILNDNGKAPVHLWCMDDEAAFDTHNERFGKQVQESGLEADYNKARENLKEAEEALVQYGLSITPAGIRETLAKGVKENATIRNKFVDATYRLNISTLKEAGL